MERSSVPPLRSLPRFFIAGLEPGDEKVELPADEYDKIHKVLRLSTGAELAIFPNNGEVWRCRLDGRSAIVLDRQVLVTEPTRRVTLLQALPRPEKLEEVVRMGSEMGVAEFVIFPSERSVVKWDAKKLEDRLRRLRIIAREACEVAYRARLPEILYHQSLSEALGAFPDCWVLSEFETVGMSLADRLVARPDACALMVGPEGGWTRREAEAIGERATTLGPRVFRVDTAAAASCALVLLS